MTHCLTEFELQGYLEESGQTPLRQMVEGHLVSCPECRAAFDRVVATHQRVNAWLGELSSDAGNVIAVDAAAALSHVMRHIEGTGQSFQGASANDHLDRLFAPDKAEIPWFVSLYENVRDLIKPERLPPLEITSKPVAVKSIWGLYDKDWKSWMFSTGFQIVVVAILMIGFTSKVVQQQVKQTFDIIDPNLKPYEAPPQKKAAGGGGGGGARQPLPVSKGTPPKFARKQFTPPMIVTERPKLAIDPTITADIPQINAPNLGDPNALSKILSNGQGFGGGMGSGSGGGLGSGKGNGFGPGEGGGVGGGVFRVGGGVSQPAVIFKVDPEYSEEARKAKYSGEVMLSIVVDTEGRARDIHVVKSLGMGLDEKAVEAVEKWKFKPGMKAGQAVNVRATIAVNFRLL